MKNTVYQIRSTRQAPLCTPGEISFFRQTEWRNIHVAVQQIRARTDAPSVCPPIVMPPPSCQDLLLASPGGNCADAMRLRIEDFTDAGRYQGQALVGRKGYGGSKMIA